MKLNLKNPIVFFDLETTAQYQLRPNCRNLLPQGISQRE